MNQVPAVQQKRTWTATLLDSRRRIGTVAAIAIAVLLGYHVVAGHNGLNVYKQKMEDDKTLAAEVKQLEQQNDRLRRHVDHLASDPDAIEFEAHRRLHYMRDGQVTLLNDTKSPGAPSAGPAK